MSTLEQARAMYSEDGAPPLPFERWREIAPGLVGRREEERNTLLARAGIAADEWCRADGFWTITLAAECAGGDRARAEDFGSACAEALAARDRSAITTEETLPEGTAPDQGAESAGRHGGEGAEHIARGDGAGEAAPAESLRIEVPSFLREPSFAPAAEEVAALAGPALSLPPAQGLHGQALSTMDIAPFALAAGRVSLPFHPPAPGDTPRDRRTETGTVELAPAMLAALFARGPRP